MGDCQLGDADRAVRVNLRRRVPEILGEALLASEEACIRKGVAMRERQRERDLDFAPCPHPFAGEIEAREIAEPPVLEQSAIRLGVGGAQHEHGEPLAAGQKLRDEAGERVNRVVHRGRPEVFSEANEFEKGAVKLHDMIFSAPGMAIAWPDVEAEPPIAFGGGGEIAVGDDQMIEGAGHGLWRQGRAGAMIADRRESVEGSVPVSAPTETELKLALSDDALHRLRNSATLATVKRPRRARIVTTYWDTFDRALARHGLTLRVRAEGKTRRQTVKAEGIAGVAMQRGEWEWPIDGDKPDLRLAAETPVAEFAKARLAPTLTTDVMRTSRLLHVEGALIEADLDEGEIRAGTQCEPIQELELELREGPLGALYRLALALHAEAPCAIETESKAARGMRLLDRLPAQPHTSMPQPLPPGITGAEALRRIVGEALGHMLANAAATRGGHAEGVHQLRVGVRRLRSALRLFAPALAEPAVAGFDRELQELGRRVGEARDWCVFCDTQLPDIEADQPDWGGLIADAAQKQRDQGFAEAAEAVSAPSFTSLALSLGAWSEDAGRQPRLLGGARLDEAIEALAPDLVGQLMRKVRKRGRQATDGDPLALHAFRKALKKLRYSLEFLDGVYAVPDKAQDRIKKLLKRLGDLNDAATAARLAEALSQQHVELGPAAVAITERRDCVWAEGLPRIERRARKLRRWLEA